ncbi:hypothetical protein N7454_007199 [Penicillium verhagenii]|nr:hypothetical protein N7454_007199 [Penicillium verhagenii]
MEISLLMLRFFRLAPRLYTPYKKYAEQGYSLLGDEQKPKCQRCERTGSSCVWQAISSEFRHGSSASALYDFADDQPWLPAGHGMKSSIALLQLVSKSLVV